MASYLEDCLFLFESASPVQGGSPSGSARNVVGSNSWQGLLCLVSEIGDHNCSIFAGAPEEGCFLVQSLLEFPHPPLTCLGLTHPSCTQVNLELSKHFLGRAYVWVGVIFICLESQDSFLSICPFPIPFVGVSKCPLNQSTFQ